METRSRVLLSDDDRALSRVQARVLTASGFDVVLVEDGSRAIEQLRSQPFDVLLTDIQMPGLSGVDLLRAVRAYDLDLPVVLMTGAPSLASAMAAVELGALVYLAKPVSNETLRHTVARACQLHRIARLKREAMQLLGKQATEAGDRAGLAAGFDRMLESMWMAFQPIVDPVHRRVFAYEALLRSAEPSLPHPGAVLDAAERWVASRSSAVASGRRPPLRSGTSRTTRSCSSTSTPPIWRTPRSPRRTVLSARSPIASCSR